MNCQNRYEDLYRWLHQKISHWQTGTSFELDELASAAIEALWKLEERNGLLAGAEGWLMETARRKRLELFANEKRAMHRVKGASLDFATATCEDININADKRSSACLEVRMAEAISNSQTWSKFTKSQREALKLHFFLGASQAEVARELGVKRQTVGGWISRCVRRLANDTAFLELLN